MAGLNSKDFSLELPAIGEFSTGEVMGHSADRLCTAFGVAREDQVNSFHILFIYLLIWLV
eukprot:Pgem_evm1s13042